MQRRVFSAMDRHGTNFLWRYLSFPGFPPLRSIRCSRLFSSAWPESGALWAEMLKRRYINFVNDWLRQWPKFIEVQTARILAYSMRKSCVYVHNTYAHCWMSKHLLSQQMKRQLRPIHQLYIWDSHVDVGLLRPLMLFKKLVFSAKREGYYTCIHV